LTDVIIVTLLRKTLPHVLKSVQKNIPNPKIILITDKGLIGDLRNKGLYQATSEFVCFVDDDIIVTKEWFDKCVEVLKTDDSVVCVGGRTEEGYTLGCSVCKTETLKRLGGFPRLDSFVTRKVKFLILNDLICEHLVSELSVFQHLFHWFVHGFYSDSKFGFSPGVVPSYRLMFDFLLRRKPSYALSYLFWFIKALYVYVINRISQFLHGFSAFG
jgi:glycosyltransferase involved in cell wall biosynthesis